MRRRSLICARPERTRRRSPGRCAPANCLLDIRWPGRKRRPMKWILALLLVAAAGATLFILIKGVVGMAQQKDISGQRSQQLMQKRIMFQAIAIVIAILLLLLMRS